MPDLSMCRDKDCPSRKECYRFTAEPSERQAYADFERPEWADQCDAYIPVKWEAKEQAQMTDLQTIRDEIAGMMGWVFTPVDIWLRGLDTSIAHPIPSTLDGIAALWPRGWAWKRLDDAWVAHGERAGQLEEIPDTGDELADRTRLLHAVLTAERDAK